METEVQESVFIAAAKRCPPRAVATRAICEILDKYHPDMEPDESLRQVNGEFIGGAEARTALKFVAHLLGPIHPFVNEIMAHDLREELRR